MERMRLVTDGAGGLLYNGLAPGKTRQGVLLVSQCRLCISRRPSRKVADRPGGFGKRVVQAVLAVLPAHLRGSYSIMRVVQVVLYLAVRMKCCWTFKRLVAVQHSAPRFPVGRCENME